MAKHSQPSLAGIPNVSTSPSTPLQLEQSVPQNKSLFDIQLTRKSTRRYPSRDHRSNHQTETADVSMMTTTKTTTVDLSWISDPESIFATMFGLTNLDTNTRVS